MRSRLYFIRTGPPGGTWLEDFETLIFIGRWSHLFNTETKEIMTLTNRPSNPERLGREGGEMWPTTRAVWLSQTGWAGRMKEIEDFVGLKPISRFLEWRERRRRRGQEFPAGPALEPPRMEALTYKGGRDGNSGTD